MNRAQRVLPLLILIAASVGATEPITIGETLTLHSEILGEDRTILVSTPPGYGRNDEGFITLYITDGGAHFTHTRGTVDFLFANGFMPQVILVGVTNTDRSRDLTPTRASLPRFDGSDRDYPSSGGASAFLDFFEEELIPYIDRHYRTLPYRVFAGHSFGGLFALNAMLTRPTLFDAWIAVSPSLQWDDDLPIRQSSSFFAEVKQLDGTLFVAMGNEETGDPRPNRLDRLEAVLENSSAEGFRWQVMRLPDENHGSVVLRAHYWGLRKVFEDWPLPRDPKTGFFTGGRPELERHYADLSSRLGFEVQPTELAVNLIGYQALNRDEIGDAIEIFHYNIDLYPDSANVYDSLGEALERSGRLEHALANYSKAVEHAKQTEDPRLRIFTRNRDRTMERIAATRR